MQKRSRRSASEIYRDYEGLLRTFRELAARAMESDPAIRRILLFGSMARGDYALYSDADILVELDSSPHKRWFDRMPDLALILGDADVPVQVFPYTVAELRKMQEAGNPFIRDALAQGIVLAERAAAEDATGQDGEG